MHHVSQRQQRTSSVPFRPVQMVVTASQMATSQFHSVPGRPPGTDAPASVTFTGHCAAGRRRGWASWQRHWTECKSAPHVCLLSSPADLALPCQPNNGPIPMDRPTDRQWDCGRHSSISSSDCPSRNDVNDCSDLYLVTLHVAMTTTNAPAEPTCMLYET